MKMAILGAGAIAAKMAKTVKGMKDVEGYAVAARELERARAFQKEHGFTRAYGSYEEMLADDQVELVYIATPHSHHYKHAKMCLDAGKHVLCEKSFTVNAAQARELFRFAEEKNLFLTEAIWTRYMPSRKIISEVIASGVIGEATSLTANLGYELSGVKRIWEPSLAGGALLDVGVYLVNFARMIFGENMTGMVSSAVFQEGVDVTDNMILTFDGTKTASMQAGVNAVMNRDGVIFGTKGYIEITNINNPEEIRVFNNQYEEILSCSIPEQITGYEYEVMACARALKEGRLECEEMPHAETVRVLEIMDKMRASWGYEIPLQA